MFSKVKSSVGPLLNANNEYVSNSGEMADILASQYSSVYSLPRKILDDPGSIFPVTDPERDFLEDVIFDEGDIVKAIDELSLTAAAGPDGFPACFLKYCKESLSKPLYIFWRKCLDQGTIPQSLKDANIIPLHKGDNRGHAANYRPVALTSHLIKIFEKIIKKHNVLYMEEKNLFNNTQHGFRPGRSCLSELISHYEDVYWRKE